MLDADEDDEIEETQITSNSSDSKEENATMIGV
jgi:hypothetical protein